MSFPTLFYVECRWFDNGDHPEDNRDVFIDDEGIPFLGEGKIVRYFRRPEPCYAEGTTCMTCGELWHDHGWIDQGGDGEVVHPGDVILARAGDCDKTRKSIPYEDYKEFLILKNWLEQVVLAD